MKWIKSENGEPTKPESVITSGDRVILNRNFRRIQATEERPEHWEYETLDMSAEQYEMYQYTDEVNSATAIVFVTMAENGTIDEVTAAEHLSVFEEWQPNVDYAVGNLRTYGEESKLYKCVQAHRSQSDWTPDAAVSLWVLAGNPAEEYPAWSQPIGAQDAYMAGDKVTYNEKHWASDIDNNVWAPGVYGWSEV